ncbi:hypothetical protein [Pseudomonas leptonychotis]|uniref:hypothetical protein n=1 Tax=Pseudomonas leptonychotis TaxID=2448482 RepID=UPI0039EFCDC9
MNSTIKDRSTAAATPLLVLAASYLLSPRLLPALPAILYFAYKKLSLELSKDTALITFDLIISLTLIGIAVGLIIDALLMISRDGEFTIALVSSGSLLTIFTIISGLCLLYSSLKLSIMSFKERSYRPKLSMGIFEALRGKRASNV